MQLTGYDFTRIAAAVGVDPRSVKRALMDRERSMRPSLRARILKAAQELGYLVPTAKPEPKLSPFGLIGVRTVDDDEAFEAAPSGPEKFDDPAWPKLDLGEEEASHG